MALYSSQFIHLLISTFFLAGCVSKEDEKLTISRESGEYLQNKKHGLWIGYFANNNKAYEGFYKLGLKDSVWKTYYENGNPLAIEQYRGGKKNGTSLIFGENGKLYSQATYFNDVFHGKRTHYYSSGQKNYETYYHKGQENGLFRLFYESGKLKQTGKIKNGKNVGEWFVYDSAGFLIEKKIYIDSTHAVLTLEFSKTGDTIKREVTSLKH